MGPSPGCAVIPELFDDLQSDTLFFRYARANIFTVNATTLYIYVVTFARLCNYVLCELVCQILETKKLGFICEFTFIN
jgi:hypothetical protein